MLSAAALGSEPLLLLAWSPIQSSLGPALPLSAVSRITLGVYAGTLVRQAEGQVRPGRVSSGPVLIKELLVDLGL